MPVFRYHFSTREYYRMDIAAGTIEEAKKELEYCGVHHQNEENENFMVDTGLNCCEESWDNDEQWELLEDEV